jgi:hypothetical protein
MKTVQKIKEVMKEEIISGNDDLRSAYFKAELSVVILRHCFPEFRQTQTVGVFCLSGFQGIERCLADMRRCGEIGLADLKMDDAFTCALKFDGSLKDFHYMERRDFF